LLLPKMKGEDEEDEGAEPRETREPSELPVPAVNTKGVEVLAGDKGKGSHVRAK
jgi:hypothetical protein